MLQFSQKHHQTYKIKIIKENSLRVVHPSLNLKREERRKRGKKRRLALFFLIIFLFSGYGFLSSKVTADYTVKKIYPPVVSAQPVNVVWPTSGSAAIGYIGSDTPVLASSEGSKVLPTASTIKLLTALVVLNQKPLGPNEDGDRVYFNNRDVDRVNEIIAIGGSYYPVTNGMSMSYHQAVEATLIGSANNIAEKLATTAFGGEAEYKKAAELYLKSNSILKTTVDDASGLSSATTSTADDMLKITLLALKVPVIKEIAALPKTQINGIDISSTNRLLFIDGIDGVKTGYTPDAGGCLLLSKSKMYGNKEYTFVASVMGQPDRDTAFSEAQKLLGTLSDNFLENVVIGKKDIVADIVSPWGTIVKVEAETSTAIYKWKNEAVTAKVLIDPLKEGSKGKRVGTATIRNGESKLILSEDLPEPSLWWRLTHVLDLKEEIL